MHTIPFDPGLSWAFCSADRITTGHILMPSGILQCLLSMGKSSSGFIPHHTFKHFHQNSESSSWELKSCIPRFTAPQLYWHLTASQSPNLETDVFFCKACPHASSYQVTLTTVCSQRWWWRLWASRGCWYVTWPSTIILLIWGPETHGG